MGLILRKMNELRTQTSYDRQHRNSHRCGTICRLRLVGFFTIIAVAAAALAFLAALRVCSSRLSRPLYS